MPAWSDRFWFCDCKELRPSRAVPYAQHSTQRTDHDILTRLLWTAEMSTIDYCIVEIYSGCRQPSVPQNDGYLQVGVEEVGVEEVDGGLETGNMQHEPTSFEAGRQVSFRHIERDAQFVEKKTAHIDQLCDCFGL